MKMLACALAAMMAMPAGVAAAADGAWPTLDVKEFAPKTPDAKGQNAGTLESDGDYVKVCDAFGAGFTYSPGTDTCIKVSGYIKFGTSIHGGSPNRPSDSQDQPSGR